MEGTSADPGEGKGEGAEILDGGTAVGILARGEALGVGITDTATAAARIMRAGEVIRTKELTL